MGSVLSSDDLQRIGRFVTERIGFYYAPDRISDLHRGFLTACQDLGVRDPLSCIQVLDDPSRSSALEEELVKNLTIGETYFFRDRYLFAQLRDSLLPDLIRVRRLKGKYLRIWCAACSTGEEAYSIAILLNHLLPDIPDWDISILATDVNPGSLHAAERGIYSRWSFREESPVPIDRYIHPSSEGRFEVSAVIKRMVRFSRLNLITDRYPSPLTSTMSQDLILCRNVLMYFSIKLAAGVVDRLNSSLIDGGWLIVSPQELNFAQRPGFVQEKRSSVFIFRKGIETKEKPDTPVLMHQTKENVWSGEYEDGGGPEDKALIPITHTSLEIITPRKKFHFPDHLIKAKESLPSSLSLNSNVKESPFCGQPDTPDLLIKAGRLSEAQIHLLEVKNPDNETLGDMEMLARAYADQGDFDRALGWCDRILGADPLFSRAYHLRAVIQQDQGDLPASVRSLRQALYADPDFIPALLMLGMILGIQGKLSEARRNYLVALDILSTMEDDAPVDETDGMPAARVREMVTLLLNGVSA